jgi:F-type H+-transporting ATPase subunit b
MSLFTGLHTSATLAAGRLFPGAEDIPFDDKGYTTIDPIFPPLKELIPGSLASIIVFSLLYWKAGPIIKKSFADRTAGIQKDLDDAAAAKTAAEAEAARIRQAQGDIDAERARLYAEADAQAEGLLADGRSRLAAEIADLEARAEADIVSAAGRGSDELRTEIAKHSSAAVDAIVRDTLDDAAQQELIENFIARVGASRGVTS